MMHENTTRSLWRILRILQNLREPRMLLPENPAVRRLRVFPAWWQHLHEFFVDLLFLLLILKKLVAVECNAEVHNACRLLLARLRKEKIHTFLISFYRPPPCPEQQ